MFTLRGLCLNSHFDNYYSWNGTLVGHFYTFAGVQNSFLQWNEADQQWVLSLYQNSSVKAVCNDTEGYPFGTLNWYFSHDKCRPNEWKRLTFSACLNNEFTCRDGTW